VPDAGESALAVVGWQASMAVPLRALLSVPGAGIARVVGPGRW